MRIITITLYCKINNDNVVINNGMSFGIELLESDKNIFFSIDSPVEKLKYFVRDYDRIYISIFSTVELKLILPILDERWVIGGPITQNNNLDVSYNFINKTIPDYLGIKDYKYTDFSTYFEPLMTMFPKHTATIVASLGGACYWGKCKFCSFVNSKRCMIFDDNIHTILDKIYTLNG